MKVLILSVCKEKLSEEEFVRPIFEITKKAGFKPKIININDIVSEINELNEEFSKLIICGTALKDFDYLRYSNCNNLRFSWIKNFKSVFGICAGYQIIAKLFSANLSKIKKIGVYDVKCVKSNSIINKDFKAYFLHNLALDVKLNNRLVDILAIQDNEVAMFKVKNKDYYGVSFHPEVLNPDIVKNFLYKNY